MFKNYLTRYAKTIFVFAAIVAIWSNLSAKDKTDKELINNLKKSTDRIWFEANRGQYPAEVLYGFKTSFGSMAVYNNKLRLFAMQGGDKAGYHSVDITFPGSEKSWSIVPSRKSSVKGSYVVAKGKSVSP